MLYSYQAKDSAGRTVTGSLDAPDERRAAQDIRDMGYFPMRLAPQRGGAATFSPNPEQWLGANGDGPTLCLSASDARSGAGCSFIWFFRSGPASGCGTWP